MATSDSVTTGTETLITLSETERVCQDRVQASEVNSTADGSILGVFLFVF